MSYVKMNKDKDTASEYGQIKCTELQSRLVKAFDYLCKLFHSFP